MDNQNLREGGNSTPSGERIKEMRETQELFQSDRGKWCLKIFSEVLLIEITGLLSRDSGLLNSGIISWNLKEFHPKLFDEYAHERPEARFNGKALFILADWFIRRIAASAQWGFIDRYTRNNTIGKYHQNYRLKDLKSILGKGLDTAKGHSSRSQIYRIINVLSDSDKEAMDYWSKMESWVHFIEKGPLEKFVLLEDHSRPLLKTSKLEMTGEVSIYKSSRRQETLCTPSHYPIEGMPTGKKDEIWQKADTKGISSYYKNLYLRSFEETPRLIRASEHNGMIGAKQASSIIEDFGENKFNTLIATPTLEMGVDLPDLPIVIHRGVPPDPSNYVQRAGRAGRDPKRALLLTYCTHKSHDLVFYDSPEMMVAGEILPPGLPCENDSIIRRHIQGLILELLAIRNNGELGDPLKFEWWGDLVDLNELANRLGKVVKENFDGMMSGRPKDWRKILNNRKLFIQDRIEKYLEILSNGLWRDLKEKSPKNFERLKRSVLKYSDLGTWQQSFEKEGERYQNVIAAHIEEIANLDKISSELPFDKREEKHKIMRRLLFTTKLYLEKKHYGHSFTYPLSYLGASGFLPNFDFPGQTTRFMGTLDQFSHNKNQNNSYRGFYTLSYDRSSNLALREFAPEQRVYGQGFVYKVDRYLARSSGHGDNNKTWGICIRGCTQLSEPESEECQFCGGDIVVAGQEKFGRPKLIEVEQALGSQLEVISDSRDQRKHSYMTQDIRKIGIPQADEGFKHKDFQGVEIYRHLTPDSQIRIVTILTSKGEKSEKDNGIRPVYKEKREGNLYVVKMEADAEETASFESFVPAVFCKGQALIVKMPLLSMLDKISDPDISKEVFYATFSEVIKRAAIRVLRLNKRNHSFHIILDKVMVKNKNQEQGEEKFEQIDVMLLDVEEGGSGIIDLIWDYWDQILEHSKELIIKDCCQSGCYECLKSYDNQQYHQIIDKSIFIMDKTVPLIDNLKKMSLDSSKSNYKEIPVDKPQEADKKSPAEEVFKNYLDSKSITYRTQSSVLNIVGKEITRPDFEIKTIKGETITIFIDGKAFHGNYEKMLSDIEKRNSLIKQGRRIITLPAGCLIPKIKQELLDELFKLIINGFEFDINAKDEGPIFEGLDYNTIKNLDSERLPISNYKAINDEALVGRLKILPDELKKYCDETHLPRAVQGDILLFAVDGGDIFSNSNKKKWEATLYTQSIFTALGYRALNIWLSPRKKQVA